MPQTGVIWDERFTKHMMGLGHPESPSRLFAIKEVLDGDGVGKEVTHFTPRPATKEEIMYIHDQAYVESVEKTAGGESVYLDPDTVACADTWMAAQYAAGATMKLIEEVLKGKVRNAFAFVRPPGHHAERNRAMGFCFFNNVAIGAEYALRKLGIKRAAIIDFDVHHGNGTQHAFYDRDDVFYASIHRAPFYPGTGLANETGEGKGKGTNLNIPLESGADDDVYKQAFDKKIIPAVMRFAPEMLLISAGFDPHQRDPLGGMRMTTDGFGWMARALADLATELCTGRHVYVLEGGYDLRALREGVEAALEVMVSQK
jgi:acetoin utilization deacetylase AcuC-like enzyme